ncbi:LicD family-domain-containing protein [Massariosphaeria phaeospora]|uniref:LicD family-domain-containing protein n=1 Tax=Massariosphaeria phaeospora TaxID=100035 RepID=A0A7C8MIM6_9PLEO|nr:LicD family-domain-containing protein [Massariosphaeria phaeospora]
MKASQYAIAVALASVIATTLASPTGSVEKSDGKKEIGLRQEQESPREDKKKNKYFNEPGTTHQLGHYDARYFHGVVSDKERTDTQLHMIRAYLDFFRSKRLDTWLAHGTLLGWWWNGRRLPWDWDMDTQVSEATLQYLGEKHNHTKHEYTSDDGKTKREYILDINPWLWERERGDGMNIIDARWVDTRNGLFIDITGLSEIHPDTAPGVWRCKNNHKYETLELYPMRETVFEGVAAKVPYSYDKILIDEYTEKALILTRWEGHIWDAETKVWIKTQAQIEAEAEEARIREEIKKEEQRKKGGK